MYQFALPIRTITAGTSRQRQAVTALAVAIGGYLRAPGGAASRSGAPHAGRAESAERWAIPSQTVAAWAMNDSVGAEWKRSR